MKVRILVSRQGPNVSDEPGDIREADEAEAAHMIAAGEAEPVGTVERATKKRRIEKRNDG